MPVSDYWCVHHNTSYMFAYEPNVSVNVHFTFLDFSSAFNTIQSRLLKAKLEDMRVGCPLSVWIMTT